VIPGDYPSNLDVRPLTTWPGELTPYSKQERSPFSTTLGKTLAQLSVELRALHAQHPILEVAIPPQQFRVDGRPYANARAEHAGVVLSLPKTSEGPLRYATDRFTTWQDNLRAITLGLEALRKVERYGITRRGEQYQGFRALPAGDGSLATRMTRTGAIEVLEATTGVRLDPADMAPIFRSARAAAHPDRHSGDRKLWDQVEDAGRVLGLLASVTP
jgi:hypothetical protein